MDNGALESFISKYNSLGEKKFYKLLISFSKEKLENQSNKENQNPELELLEHHNKLMSLFRRTGNEDAILVAKCFRKAAHEIYRYMLKIKKIKINKKFLNQVK